MTELIRLSDYFQPLTPQTFSYYLGLLIFLDILGTYVKKIIVKSTEQDNSRILNWLIGLGFFVFIWFILRFFIPPHQTPLIVSILLLLGFSFPSYVKNQEYKKILQVTWDLKVPLLTIAPFLPAVFVKASLPPYYSDEMAYQFISPSTLASIDTWHFVGKFYQNLPRVFNYFFTLVFSLTKTYSPVRLFHFSILITAMMFAYQKLKLFFGFFSALLFVLIFFSLPIATIQTATIGFVDVATYSFILIAVLNALEFFSSKSSKLLLISTLFWAMALGTKYTTITVFVSFILGSILVFRPHIKLKTLTKIFSIMLVFGGYWYVKNLIVFGNPTYPLFFKCYRYAEICNFSLTSFSSWTTPVTLGNILPIFRSLLPGSQWLQTAFVVSIPLVILNINKKTKKISLILIATMLFELILTKYFSGFHLRYQQHIRLEMIFLIVIQLGNQYKRNILKILSWGFYLILTISILGQYKSTIADSYQRLLTQKQIDYALGKIDIYDWIDNTFPSVAAGIYWCENPPSGKRTELVRLDPDMIWYGETGFMRSFTTNCFIKEDQLLDGIPLNQFIDQAKVKKLKFWTVTTNPCIPDSQVKIKRHEEVGDDHKLYLRRLNNIIVCNSEEVKPNLYLFNYEKL